MEDTHSNAFYFDETSQAIYVSFRNISRVVKIKYPEGDAINFYGMKYNANNVFHFGSINIAYGTNVVHGNQFCYQHSCRYSQYGYLYLFNNNNCNYPAYPKIVLLKEQGSGGVQKLWEFDCKVEDSQFKLDPSLISKGGTVYELPDKSMFATSFFMQTALFIVNREKHILWSALYEQWDKKEKKWTFVSMYKASIVSHNQLEDLIWKTEINENDVKK